MIVRRERIRGMVLCSMALVCLSLLSVPAMAQFDSATVTGIVTDSTKSTVPGAELKAINEATNIDTSAVTDNEGRFTFSNLRPGSYTIKVSAKGFKQFVSTGFELQVNQAARLDISLTVGEV